MRSIYDHCYTTTTTTTMTTIRDSLRTWAGFETCSWAGQPMNFEFFKFGLSIQKLHFRVAYCPNFVLENLLQF